MTDLELTDDIFEPIFGYRPFRTGLVVECNEVAFANSNMPDVKRVIFNENATIVYFEDGTKCVVRKSANDVYNREHAVVYAIVKRAYGTVNPETGVVEGNGMGNMLSRLVNNAIDQTAQKKAANTSYVGDSDHEHDDVNYKWVVERRGTAKNHAASPRDKFGRFAKKSNRK